eukprot:Selendium_serpulae@DN2672_c0_g1_i2.p1
MRISLALLVLALSGRAVDAQKVEIASAEIQSAEKEVESFFETSANAQHAVSYGPREHNKGHSFNFDPNGNLYKPLYQPYTQDVHARNSYPKEPMHMPQYPGYDMYHPRRQYAVKPVLDYYPCCHYAAPQKVESVNFNLHNRSPAQNCRALGTGFLRDHQDEHYFHRCSYGNPDGGPIDPTIFSTAAACVRNCRTCI